MKQYLSLMTELLAKAKERDDRTGVGTLSKFGHQMRFDLQEGFPLVTTKKVHLRSVVHELLWFLSGDTNIKYLVDNGVSIWTDWPLKAYNKYHKETGGEGEISQEMFERWIRDDDQFAMTWGDLGPVYGKQWRRWGNPDYVVGWGMADYPIDQIANVIDNIKRDPYSRWHIVSAWNPADADKVALHWCHCLFQFYVEDGKLSCQLYQRSADVFLGVPFNIASYALLTHMIAQQCDLDVGELIWTGGDVHLYLNHIPQAELQVSREPLPLPQMRVNKAPSIDDYQIEDFEIVGYSHHPAIQADVAV